MIIGYFALKGLNVTAQGETPGNGPENNMNPEGVQFLGAFGYDYRCCALSGLIFFVLHPQGFTLSYHILPLRG